MYLYAWAWFLDRSNWPDCDLVRRASAEKWQVQWTLKNGLEMLPNRLGELLRGRGVDIRLGVPCTKLEFSENKRVKVGDIECEKI